MAKFNKGASRVSRYLCAVLNVAYFVLFKPNQKTNLSYWVARLAFPNYFVLKRKEWRFCLA